MWQCVNCRNQLGDQYAFCWHCGTKRVPNAPQPTIARPSQLGEPAKVPTFASFEEMAPVPRSHQWIWRRGPHIRILSYLLIGAIVIILKLSDSFLGAYGNYAFRIAAVCVLILILWRFFRRDKTEGVGVKLN